MNPVWKVFVYVNVYINDDGVVWNFEVMLMFFWVKAALSENPKSHRCIVGQIWTETMHMNGLV